jgi:uncharacterized protein (TIGR02231 family)
MMKFVLCAAALLVAASATAAEIDTPSEVSSVVVYPDRARVTRSASTQVSKGSHEVLISGLPVGLDVTSLRVEGSGTAKVVLGSLDVRRNYGSDVREGRARQLQERIRALEDADKELSDASDAARFEVAFVSKLVEKSTTQVGAEMLAADDRAAEADALVTILGRRYRQAQAELRRVAIERRDLASQLQAARSDFTRLSGTGTDDFRVVVSILAKTAGRLDLDLTYTTGGAHWRSTYDARFDPATDSVEMTYGAWVWQATGEDWGDARLLLSTAQPALGLQAPALSPWILRQAPPPPRRSSARGRVSASKSSVAGADLDDDEWSVLQEPSLVEEVYVAEQQTASATIAGAAVEFAIPGRITVPGDGTRKRVTISSWRIDGVEVTYLVSPSTSAHAFQWAAFVHQQEWPLLAGELQAFVGQRYVGQSSIGRVAPGDKVELPFGVEDRIVVERELLEKGSGPKGLFGKKSSVAWTYEIRLKSLLDREVEVEVREAVPVSEYTKYEVKVLDDTSEYTEDRRGILVFASTLVPDTETTLVLHYVVAFPTDERPWGL